MSMTIICEDDMQEKIDCIQRQTDYSEIQVREKLIEKNMDHIAIIKEFMGVPEKKPEVVKSIQQTIYSQLRKKMNDSVKDFNRREEEKLKHEIAVNEMKNRSV